MKEIYCKVNETRRPAQADLTELVNQFETWANVKIETYSQLMNKQGISSIDEYSGMIFSLADAIAHIKMFAGGK